MITDHDIAELCVGSYAAAGDAVTWDFWENGATNMDVAYGVKIVDGVAVVIFPGSVTFLDWRRDLDTWADTPHVHPQLGPLHEGFYLGMEMTWDKIKSRGALRMIFGGHSLGAARANNLTGLASIDGAPPIAKVLFGEPKSGFQQLAAITSKVPGRTYRNGSSVFHDVVTDVPYYISPLLYSHDRDFTLVRVDPPAIDEFGFFAWHHIQLYSKALSNMAGVPIGF